MCFVPTAPAPAAEPAAAEQPATEGETITLTWGFWGSPEEKASHERVANAFMAEHPEIKVELWHQPWDDYFTKLQALWASGDTKVIHRANGDGLYITTTGVGDIVTPAPLAPALPTSGAPPSLIRPGTP